MNDILYNADLLAVGIVEQAAKDYIRDMVYIKKHNPSPDKAIGRNKSIQSCIIFFQSEWFTILVPGIDCKTFQRLLDEQIDDILKNGKKPEYFGERRSILGN